VEDGQIFAAKVSEQKTLPVENTNFTYVYLVSPIGMIPSEFGSYLLLRKTRVPGLLCGVVHVILCLAVLVQFLLVTDGRTDRHTMTNTMTANIALAFACSAVKSENVEALAAVWME